MALFSRRRRRAADQTTTGANRFWSWWAGARAGVTQAYEQSDARRIDALVAPRVREYHRELNWHVGPGTRARLMLVLSGARHPALRAVAERWLAAGPDPDVDWEYHAAFPPEPGAFESRVRVGAGLEIDPAQAVALAVPDDRRYRVDLSVFHPQFDHLDDLARNRVANVLVGWALGEDETDRWIGRITVTPLRPLDSVPVSMLPAVTAQLAERWGGERWSTLEGSFGNRRLIAAVRHPLHRVDYPLFDEHIAVRLPYTDALPDGLPTPQAMAELTTFEQELMSRISPDALLVAQQTASGERLLHFYADSTARQAWAIRELLGGYLGPLATVQAEYDPGWQRIDHLRA
jgi:Family of unknown function (DUF695)